MDEKEKLNLQVGDVVEHHTEDWRWFPELEEEYLVSSLGRVKSVDRIITYRDGRVRRVPEKFLKLSANSKGYFRLRIKKKNRLVHVAVAVAFLGQKENPSHEVRHLNDVKTDNRVGNLCWGTRSENRYDSIRNGTDHFAKRTECKNGHPYVEGSYILRITESGTRKRVCKECLSINDKRYKEKWGPRGA